MRAAGIMGLVLVLWGGSVASVVAGDSSIPADMQKGIHSAITDHVNQHLVSGRYVIYDAVAGHLKKLKLEQVHEGIGKMGDFYVACADFVDPKGIKYDLDLLVAEEQGQFRVLETVVHSIDGKKRAYHLEE